MLSSDCGVPIRMYEMDETDIAEVFLEDIEQVVDPTNLLDKELIAAAQLKGIVMSGLIHTLQIAG